MTVLPRQHQKAYTNFTAVIVAQGRMPQHRNGILIMVLAEMAGSAAAVAAELAHIPA